MKPLNDPQQNMFYMKSNVGMAMQSLAATMPIYTDKDLVTCTRGEHPEVWTLKAFKPGELKFLAIGTEIKD